MDYLATMTTHVPGGDVNETADGVLRLTWQDVEREAAVLAGRWAGTELAGVYGISQGGAVPAVMVARHLNVPVLDEAERFCLVVDDVVDSGATLAHFDGHHIDALYRKTHAPSGVAPHATVADRWIAFPWERGGGEPTDAVIRLLSHIGEDPTREGLRRTPYRVVKALREMTDGYTMDPAAVLSTTFEGECDEMVVVSGVTFTSM